MSDRYGASPEAWRHYQTLGLTPDLLPVVSNPEAKISSTSKIRKVGKTPSRYNASGFVSGIPEWTRWVATDAQVERWSEQPDYGICIQTRRLRAIDYDADDHRQSDHILKTLGGNGPVRHRLGSYRVLIPFWYSAPLAKHVIPVSTGVIEILADGQQFVAEGTHESGERYVWEGDWSEVPVLDEVDFAMLLAELREMATGEIKVAREKREGVSNGDTPAQDDVVEWLVANWETKGEGQKGEIYIRCPFDGEHTSDSGDSSTAYFPAGTGGYEQGHFVCLHAHCAGRGDGEFLEHTGFASAQFSDLSGEAPCGCGLPDRRLHLEGENSELGGIPNHEELGDSTALVTVPGRWPRLTRDSNSKIEPTMNNLLLAVAHPGLVHRHVAYDTFKDELVWAPSKPDKDGAPTVPWGEAQWRPFRDSDYALVRQQLELRGFKPMGQEMLRMAVHTIAEGNVVDTAGEWLRRLEWDGVERVERFCIDVWGWEDSLYARAVGRYVWTGLAGRVLQPGVRADMAPILVGEQGKKKSTAIQLMAPDEEFFVEIKFDEKDADQARLMRGKLVAELGELRGLKTRALEDIKTFITRRHEDWVPKFKEFSSRYRRRLLFFGTTNDVEIFDDPTGERRWLPGTCVNPIDIELLQEWREQLWAEGKARFELDGVDWREAEILARAEHDKFKVTDAWEPYIMRWLHDENAVLGAGTPAQQPFVTIGEALAAVGVPSAQIDRGKQMRMGKVLQHLGFERKRVPMPNGERPWAYVRP